MNCGHDLEELILFQADELEGPSRALVQARLAACSVCQHELDRIGQFAAWQAQPVEFDMAAVTAARARAYAAIGGSWKVRMRKFLVRVKASTQSLAPLPQVALALLFVVVGFAGGRSYSTSALVQNATDTRIIRDIEINATTGEAVVRYAGSEASTLTGGLDDPSMRTVLQTAMGNSNNARTRLHALRTVGYLAMVATPDSGLVGAVLSIIRADQNDALKLRAIRALDALYQDAPLPSTARSALLDVLVSPAGDGVRIAALDVLMVQDLSTRDTGRLRQASQSDENPYVRAGATRALDRIASVPLESIR